MANDTKDIIIAILKYLDDSMDDERIDFSKVNAESLKISEPKYNRVLSMMLEDGYIVGLAKVPISGVTYDSYKAIDPRITGIDYLESNKLSTRVYGILKGIKEWIPGM